MEIDIAGELARQIVQVIGVLVLGVCGWLIRKLIKAAGDFHDSIYSRLDHLDKCIDDLKALRLDGDTDLQKEIAYLKGILGQPLKDEIK